MVAKIGLPVVALTSLLAMSPVAAVAQEESSRAGEPPAATQGATDLPSGSDSGSVLVALQPSSEHAALLLASPAVHLPTSVDSGSLLEASQQDDEAAPTPSVSQSKGSGTGLGFMIGGAGALVGGLLIGGTGGALIAAGGVALGVYGAIIYF